MIVKDRLILANIIQFLLMKALKVIEASTDIHRSLYLTKIALFVVIAVKNTHRTEKSKLKLILKAKRK